MGEIIKNFKDYSIVGFKNSISYSIDFNNPLDRFNKTVLPTTRFK